MFFEKKQKKTDSPIRGILCDLFWDGCWWPTYQRFGDKVGSRRRKINWHPAFFFKHGKLGPLFLFGGMFKKTDVFHPQKGVVSKNSGRGEFEDPHLMPFWSTPQNPAISRGQMNGFDPKKKTSQMYSALVIRGWRGIRMVASSTIAEQLALPASTILGVTCCLAPKVAHPLKDSTIQKLLPRKLTNITWKIIGRWNFPFKTAPF